MSRAPSPAGVTPASSSACQHAAALRPRARGARRRPRRCSRCRRPTRARRRTRSAARRSAAPRPRRARCGPSSARASGPWTASTTRESVMSSIVALPRAVEERGFAQRVDERLGVRRVGHHQEVTGRGPPHDDVVDDVGVVVVEQVRVLRPARRDAVEIVGERPLQRGERARAAHVHRAEVRHVEDDRALAARPVLLEHAGVLDGHLPAAERHHARAEGAVLRRRAASASTRIPAPIPGRRPRSPAAGRGTGRAWPRPVPSASCDGGSSPYFTSSCR